MSWAELQSILAENREQRATEAVTPPVSCPNHGEPLDVREDGVRNCPFGDYRYE